MLAGKLVITRYYLRSVLSILTLANIGSVTSGEDNEDVIKEIDFISKTTSVLYSTANDPQNGQQMILDRK